MSDDRAGGPVITAQRLQSNWQAITAELDAPRAGVVERALRRIGVRATTTRVILATPALRRAWFVAIFVAVLLGVGTANDTDPRGSLFVFLVIAPLLPLLGVALAFGPRSDPAHEIQLAMPMRGFRLVALRTVTVLVVSIVAVLPLSMTNEIVRPMAAAWLLPALATTSATVALMTRVATRVAAVAVGVTWIVGALVVREAAADPLAAFGVAGQLVAIAVAVVAVSIAVFRRTRFDTLAVGDLAALA
jgi:hypothetical protein